jgi:hypothetical protein
MKPMKRSKHWKRIQTQSKEKEKEEKEGKEGLHCSLSRLDKHASLP